MDVQIVDSFILKNTGCIIEVRLLPQGQVLLLLLVAK